MKRYSVSQAAAKLKISRQRLDQLLKAGIAHAKKEPLTGWRYLTERELARLKQVKRPTGRPSEHPRRKQKGSGSLV